MASRFPIWVGETDSRRRSQHARTLLPYDKPPCHEATGATEKKGVHMIASVCNVGISRQIRDKSVELETLHSYILGQLAIMTHSVLNKCPWEKELVQNKATHGRDIKINCVMFV